MKNKLTDENLVNIVYHKTDCFIKDLTGMIDDPKQQMRALLTSGPAIIACALESLTHEGRLIAIQNINEQLLSEFANEES